MKILLLICVLIAPVLAQDKSELQVKYDRISNNTTVSTKTREVTDSIWMTLFFNHAGTRLEEPKKMVGIVFDSYSPDWKYLRDYDQRLFVLADGERFTLDSPQRESRVNSGTYPYSRRVTVSERLIFAISTEQLALIAKASSVEMRLGSEQFSLGKDAMKALRQFFAATGQ